MRYTPEQVKAMIDGARSGDKKAAAQLGNICDICGMWGVDMEEMEEWLRAYMEENPDERKSGERALATLRLHRGRTEQERRAGLEASRKMAEEGNDEAIANMALANLMGLGTPRNVAKAIQWYRRLNMHDEDAMPLLESKLIHHIEPADMEESSIMHVGYGIYTSSFVEVDGCSLPEARYE